MGRWWRVFRGKRARGLGKPRRRRAERYAYAAHVVAKCKSWPKFVELFTGDVSEGGLFVPTDQRAEPGETVEVTLRLPDGVTFPMTGTVVNIIDAERAAQFGKRAGLGIQLAPLDDDGHARFAELLEAARSEQPRPEDTTASGAPEPPTAPPPDRLPAESVHISDRSAIASLQDLHAGLELSSGVPEPIGEEPAVETSGVEMLDDDDLMEIDEDFEVATAADAPLPGDSPRRRLQTVLSPSPPPPGGPPPKRMIPRQPAGPGPIIGIDFGTTYTSVAAVRGKKVTILKRPDGEKSSPSVVSFPGAHADVLVGAEARERLALDPAHTVASPKRLLGRPWDDTEVQSFLAQAPYRTFAGPDGTTVVDIWQQHYAIPQLVAYLLRDVRNLAETHLGQRIERAVISVPISFDRARIEALRRAGQMAQLEIASVIDEPSAAALANRFDPHFGTVVGLYDFGGGTFDFSVVDVSRGDFRVLATAGDTWLGGDDFDTAVADAVANQFWRKHKVDLRKQAVEWQRLLFACERAKRALSASETAVISVPDVLRTAEGMVHLELSIDRPTMARACHALIQRSLRVCGEALALAGLAPDALGAVYLSGGTTYIPAVRAALAQHFRVPIRTGVPPEHAVCLGAAIHGAQLQFNSATTLAAR